MKNSLRVLHALAVVAFGAGLYAIVMIVSVLIWFRCLFQAMAVSPEQGQEALQWVLWLAWGKYFLAAVLLGLGVYAMVKKLSWRILLPGLVIVTGGLLYLRWDGEAPKQPDLGPRVTDADEGYRIVMWMAKDSPYGRLGESGALKDAERKVLALPKETADWPEHIRLHRGEILLAWERDKLGREWIDAINGCPPAGVWTQNLKSALIQYTPIRLSLFARTARAYALALDGKRDEAVESLLPMITAWQHIQRTGPALLNQMIAQVVLKQCYRVTGEVLRMGEVGRETRKKLSIILQQAQVAIVFRNALLGEYDGLADSVDEGLANALREQQKKIEQPWQNWLVPHAALAGGNQTKRALLRWLQRPCELAIRRDLKGLEKLEKASPAKWYLKNQFGNMLIEMAKPAYAKVVEEIWQIEDLRLGLLKQLEEP